ncbi:hypothetical protein C8Q74DRAFT_20514 [Fomes fomentarius]|nr:hypothetical protein C8Q74DRAFT_20514 [Fomes fomentarius]
MSEEEQPRVLTASVADFRYFAALLKGVNFANRACVSITSDGFTVSVEEARVLTGELSADHILVSPAREKHTLSPLPCFASRTPPNPGIRKFHPKHKNNHTSQRPRPAYIWPHLCAVAEEAYTCATSLRHT